MFVVFSYTTYGIHKLYSLWILYNENVLCKWCPKNKITEYVTIVMFKFREHEKARTENIIISIFGHWPHSLT